MGKHIANWMVTLTLAITILVIALLLSACQTTKSCRQDCVNSIDNISVCEDACQ